MYPQWPGNSTPRHKSQRNSCQALKGVDCIIVHNYLLPFPKERTTHLHPSPCDFQCLTVGDCLLCPSVSLSHVTCFGQWNRSGSDVCQLEQKLQMLLHGLSSSLALFLLPEVGLVPNKGCSFSLDPGLKTHSTGGSPLPPATTCGLNKKGNFVAVSHWCVFFCLVYYSSQLTKTGTRKVIVRCSIIHDSR